MTTEKTERSKGISILTVIAIILVVGGIVSPGYVYWTYRKGVYSMNETISVGELEFNVKSLSVSVRVAGYRGEVAGATQIVTGNQTAHAEPNSKFVIIELTISNKENNIVSIPKANSMLLETEVAKFYTGNSIFDIFQTKSRTSPTAEELNKLYCNAYPETLNPKSSETTCVIFHVKEIEEAVQFRHVDEKGKTAFVVSLK